MMLKRFTSEKPQGFISANPRSISRTSRVLNFHAVELYMRYPVSFKAVISFAADY